MEEPQQNRKKLLQWHPAFYAGLQIELEEDADNLIFDNEYQLGKKPMEVDVLIIKKDKALPVHKNIGRIFRKYNIIEYKSPEDSLDIDDFYKVYGYACFYKADTGGVDSISVSELTITLVSRGYPRNLVRHLESIAHYTVRKAEKGIYYVEGDKIPIQLLVTRQLSKKENLWLSSLTNNLSEREIIDELLNDFEKHRDNSLYVSVMDMILHANREIFEEVKGMYGFIQELFKDELSEAKEKTWNTAWDEAEECFAVLTQKLIQDSRTEDLMRATDDKAFRRRLYKEYGIEIRTEAVKKPE